MKNKNNILNRIVNIFIGIIIICISAVVLTGSSKLDNDINLKNDIKELKEKIGLVDKNEETTQEETKEKETRPVKIYYPFNEKELVDLVDSANGARVLSTFGEVNLSEDVLKNIQNEITKLESQYINVSFVVLDISRRFGIAYNADWRTTAESTIKAPYGCALLEAAPNLFDQYKFWFEPMIKVSDNFAYESLRSRFGWECLRRWCNRANVGTSVLYQFYPVDMRARDMAKFWILIYEYLNSDKAPSDFVNVFNGTAFSSIYKKLGQKYFVQSKPGWNYYQSTKDADKNPLNEEMAINDAGVIYAKAGPYILAIFSDSYPNEETLAPIIGAIDEAVASAPEYK